MRPLRIAVIGCGSAGPAAALLLHRAGHQVDLFERAPELLPVGAGVLLQPSGLAVLEQLGLRDAVIAHGAPVSRLHCTTWSGARLLDLRYDELAAGLCGIGVHRASLLHELAGALHAESVPLHLGVHVEDIEIDGNRANLVAKDARHGPFDLVIAADGARSQLRPRFGPPHRAKRYPWGALWFLAEDPNNAFAGQLRQIVHGPQRMVGFLPTGTAPGSQRPLVSLFWSVELRAVQDLYAAGVAAWKHDLLRLAPHAEPLIRSINHLEQLTLASYMDVRMKPWHRGPVVFLGDAAHATSPQLGQGVNLALRDASALATALATATDVPHALEQYGQARRHQLAYYQLATRALTPFFQSHSRTLGWLRDLGFRLGHHLPPLRRRMTRTMAGLDQGLLRPPLTLAPLAAGRPALTAGPPSAAPPASSATGATAPPATPTAPRPPGAP